MDKYKETLYYDCAFCQKTFPSKEMIDVHLDECVLNFVDNSTCLTCKHCVVNQVPPSGVSNGYQSIRLIEVFGSKNYITCDKGAYSGKISEDKILRNDKQCYDGVESLDEEWIIKPTKAYIRHTKLVETAIIEQQEIDEEIDQLHKDMKELTDEEFDAKYSDM